MCWMSTVQSLQKYRIVHAARSLLTHRTGPILNFVNWAVSFSAGSS